MAWMGGVSDGQKPGWIIRTEESQLMVFTLLERPLQAEFLKSLSGDLFCLESLSVTRKRGQVHPS